MNKIPTEIQVSSEDGKESEPYILTIRMDGSKPTCPLTFIADGKPVFSLGSDEVDDFCEILTDLVP